MDETTPEKKKKILLICGRTVSVINFRAGLIRALLADGYHVSVLCLNEERREEITALGVDFYCLAGNNRSTNPLRVLSLLGRYKKLIRQLSPDIVFTFQATPNMLGCLAAHRAGVKRIFAMVEGAGDVFVNEGHKWKMIRAAACFLYRRAFRHAEKVFFLNTDDIALFTGRKLVPAAHVERVFGIGVDQTVFTPQPMPEGHPAVFLMVARMVQTKGIFEYCRAAQIVRSKYPQTVFYYLGEEFTVKRSDIQPYIDAGDVRYLGYERDVRPAMTQASCLVLPSYREGMPVTVMEAQSLGRAVIVTDVTGCRDTVKSGYNGYLVPVRDAAALAERCIYLLEHPDLFATMGRNAATFAKDHFDADKINRQILSVIK